MQFKKFNGTTWETVRHKIYGSGTEQLASFPAMIQASGEELTEYTIYGNTIQSGTPTPEAPVGVVGCGEKTAQLFDKNTAVYGEYLNEDGTVYPEAIQKTAWLSDYIPVAAGLTYTLNRTGSRRGKFYKADKTPYQTETMDFSGLDSVNTFTIPETVAYIRFTIYKGVATPDAVMLNAGSTALPYEPYGFKIPVTSGGVTTNLYLDAPLGAGDTLSYTDTGIALPTVDGDNTISFGTTVQPSAMSATFKGWHPVQGAKQYDGSEWR